MNEDLFYNTCEKEHLIYMLKEKDKDIKYYKETLMTELDRIRNDFFKVVVKFEEEKFQKFSKEQQNQEAITLLKEWKERDGSEIEENYNKLIKEQADGTKD